MSEECGRPAALAAGRTRKGAGEEGLVSGAAARGGTPQLPGRGWVRDCGVPGVLQVWESRRADGEGWGRRTVFGVPRGEVGRARPVLGYSRR